MKFVIPFAVLAMASAASHAADSAAALDLAKKSGCLACHAVDKKLVGPAWQDVAKKYAGDAGAEERLFNGVKKGSKGVWGPVPMPPNVTLKDADARTLVRFILSLK